MRTRTPSRSLSLALSALAAALLSCGGGGDGGEPLAVTIRFCASGTTTSCVEPSETEFPAVMRQVFLDTATRMEAIATNGAGPVSVNMNCGSFANGDPQQIPLNETVHGLIILASAVEGMDSQILAQSGPCIVRSRSGLPLVAVMRFNQAHMQTYYSSSILAPVVLHEMFHTLGFGTIWCDRSKLQNSHHVGSACLADPIYTGRQALSAGKAANDLPPAWTTIPVEDLGGSGTYGSHWRESTFGLELMTGYFTADQTNPLSAMSIGSLQDLGYTVDLTQADVPAYQYVAPPALRALPSASTIFVGDDVIHTPPAVAEEP